MYDRCTVYVRCTLMYDVRKVYERKILSRGVWYLLPNLDSGWVSEGIVFLVQLIFSSLDFTTFQLVLDLEPIKMQLHRKGFSMWLTLWLTLWLTFIYVAHVAQSEPH